MSTSSESSATPSEEQTRLSGFGIVRRYTKGYGGLILLAICLGAAGGVFGLVQPMIVSSTVEAVQESSQIAFLVLLLVLLSIASAVVLGIQQVILGKVGASIVRRARRTLADRMLSLPMAVHERRAPGELASRLTSDPALIQSAVSDSLVAGAGGVFILVGAVIALLWLDPITFLVAFSVALLSIVLALAAGRLVRRYRIAMQDAIGEMGAEIQRASSSMRVLRAFNATGLPEARIQKMIDSVYANAVKLSKLFAIVQPLSSTLTQIALGCTILIAGVRVASGAIDLPTFIAFLMYFSMLIQPLGTLSGVIYVFQEAAAGHHRIQEILNSPPEKHNDQSNPDATYLVSEMRGDTAPPTIAFRNVAFGYDETPVLEDISFIVPSGQRTAIVGPTGAGKSTIFALLERFYQPETGEIELNGIDIKSVDRSTLRSIIGYADQGSIGVSGSLRENLTLGQRSIPDERMREVLESLSLGPLLERIGYDLDHEIGESALQLSGGERQRVSIARAVLRDPRVLLLDEPTASLDSRTEASVGAFIDGLGSDTTVVTIAHRLSTVINADRIIVMNEGKIMAAGTHLELLEESGFYSDLISRQLVH